MITDYDQAKAEGTFAELQAVAATGTPPRAAHGSASGYAGRSGDLDLPFRGDEVAALSDASLMSSVGAVVISSGTAVGSMLSGSTPTNSATTSAASSGVSATFFNLGGDAFHILRFC